MKSWFKSQEQANVATLRAKLQDAERDLADAEQELRDRALASALIADPYPAAGQLQKVRDARDRLEVLNIALQAAIAAEEQRVRERQAELRKTEIRSMRQRIGALLKDAQAAEVHWANYVACFDRCLAKGQEIIQLAGPDAANFKASLAVVPLRHLFQDEMNRVGADNPADPTSRVPAPGCHYRLGFTPLTTPTLFARLEQSVLGAWQLLAGKHEPVPLIPAPKLPAAAEQEPIPAAIAALNPYLVRGPEQEQRPLGSKPENPNLVPLPEVEQQPPKPKKQAEPIDPETLARNRAVAGLDALERDDG